MLDKLPNLRSFMAVAEANSFAKAARKLNMANSSVSRQIAQLESQLNVSLFTRTTRHVQLSPAGEILYGRASGLIMEMENLAVELSADNVSPHGTLKVSVPWWFSQLHLAPLLPEFLAMYPDLRVVMQCDDGMTKLVEEGFDVAVRLSRLKDSNLIARRLGPHSFAMAASPEYLARHARVTKPEDLREHAMLSFNFSTPYHSWTLRKQGRSYRIPLKDSVLTSNNADILKQCALDGAGIIIQPVWGIKSEIESGALIQLLPDFEVTSTTFDNGIFAVYSKESKAVNRVKVFVDFLSERLKVAG